MPLCRRERPRRRRRWTYGSSKDPPLGAGAVPAPRQAHAAQLCVDRATEAMPDRTDTAEPRIRRADSGALPVLRGPGALWSGVVGDRDSGPGGGDGLGRDRSGGALERAGPAGHLAVRDLAGAEVDVERAVQHAALSVPRHVPAAGGRRDGLDVNLVEADGLAL